VAVTEDQADIFILLIDDDEDDRFIMRKALNKVPQSIRLAEVSHGQEAIDFLNQLISEHKVLPDMIILDLNMPVMNGQQFLQICKSHPTLSAIPVIVLTTSREPEILREVKEMGASAALTKSASIQDCNQIAMMIVDYWFTGIIDWKLYHSFQSA
jgi:CheY-like chemotaxis protein